MSKPKILLLDIESSPALCYTWSLHKVDLGVEQIVSASQLLCFSAKWFGEDEVFFHRTEPSSGATKGAFNKMVRAAHALLSEADAVVHFNGTSYDIPKLNQEFLRLGLTPPPPFHHIDLLKVIQSKFGMLSNKLAFVAPYLKVGSKVEHEGFSLWTKCLNWEPEAWAKMEMYNKQDVALLEPLYLKLLPWIDNHPNCNLYAEGELDVCPNCGSEKIQRRGIKRNTTLTYKRYWCTSCGRWSQSRFAERDRRVKIR